MDAANSGTATGGAHPQVTREPAGGPPREIRKSLVERARRAGQQLADSRRARRAA